MSGQPIITAQWARDTEEGTGRPAAFLQEILLGGTLDDVRMNLEELRRRLAAIRRTWVGAPTPAVYALRHWIRLLDDRRAQLKEAIRTQRAKSTTVALEKRLGGPAAAAAVGMGAKEIRFIVRSGSTDDARRVVELCNRAAANRDLDAETRRGIDRLRERLRDRIRQCRERGRQRVDRMEPTP